ncbi:RIP metalloprotease RseP [Rhodoferax mekongensis]|uniref:Zinc metalloprotease n=1 Tax=Rhodoferax mekongensis TaxID=3068341 RepID=A0ABZ0AUA8_9BURK|nr:RIP metalloprotease RseP [Rhodoferax sp. TBRC 17307]WNO03246.1 RIP metalloprotease RseP [Rhodoferax sp. TBRC 17307]
MQTILAFLVAIGLLVAVHEWGHFCAARLCGVKVLRFSIGFGPKLWGWSSRRTGTEFVLSAIPLGGYVKMLDGREGPVAAYEASRAFDKQSLRRRSFIVAAGPLANLVLAIGLYSLVNWQPVDAAAPVLPTPVASSLADKEGWVGGERILEVGVSQDALTPISTFDEFRWWLTTASLDREVLYVRFSESGHDGSISSQLRSLDLRSLGGGATDASLFKKIGWPSPFSKPVMGDLSAEGRAAAAGLMSGDVVLAVDGKSMRDAHQLRALIRSSPEVMMAWQVKRSGQVLSFAVTPKAEKEGVEVVGRVGAFIGGTPDTVSVQYGFAEGITRAVGKTWDIARMSLVAMGQMITGQVSLRNLNGPLAIADYAGKSAALGFVQFLSFLALISISLGVLNLLPLPVLDGGHLMYYLWEGLTGIPVPEKWWEVLQRAGVALLLVMMSIAFYNDVLHILG